MNMQAQAKAFITVCNGADEGGLCLLRSLGRAGIECVVFAENDRSSVLASRYCREAFVVPQFTRDAASFCRLLLAQARKQALKPVIFPSADPDLLLLSEHRASLEPCMHVAIPPQRLVQELSDKLAFDKLAARYSLPVPRTVPREKIREAPDYIRQMRFPLVIKPATALAWRGERIEQITEGKKAVIVLDYVRFTALYRALIGISEEMIIQEYIPGDDDAHVDVHIYMNSRQQVLGAFSGQKLRLSPAYAGSGCFVRSVYIGDVVSLSTHFLQAMKYEGLANINFKRHAQTGEYLLMEINPRVSQWHILASECGVNLPFIAYQDLTGAKVEPAARQKENVFYLDFKRDLSAFFQYRHNGDITWPGYLASLCRFPMVHQHFSWDDSKPFFREVANISGKIWKRLARVKGGGEVRP